MGHAVRRMAMVFSLLVSLLPSEASAAAPARVFALVIANNRSTLASQPDLQYADDDGARYYRLFRALADEPDVALLTTFDRASRGPYAPLLALARAPTRSELLLARERLAEAILEAHQRGERTVFYLVYAGHGEVVDGRGYLDLEDQRIDGEFLEHELLERVPADTKHVLLDSCDSFFVMNPRKPGGKRWATPKDMAFGFSARHPEIGLFLSTNSESEVFEWSELESGVFSHEVRSGLSGGADVDGDGAISYLELAGFIEQANRGIARESLRPQLFFRGPHGDQHAALFPTAAMRGRRVTLDARQTRMWIKSAAGERLLDVHKEPGSMTLVVPDDGGELSLYVQSGAPSERVVVSQHNAPEGSEPVLLASLAGQLPALGARGSRLFGELFAAPYGPAALAQYRAASTATPEPVFGLSQADTTRMHNYLTQLAAMGRADRVVVGTIALGFAAMSTGAVAALASQPDRADSRNVIIGLSALSAGLISSGLYVGLRPTSGELALANFEYELGRGGSNSARAVAATEHYLSQLATRERRIRTATFWVHLGLAVGAATVATGAVAAEDEEQGDRRDHAVTAALLYGEAAFFAAIGTALRLIDTPTERMLKLYREDPSMKLHFGGSVGPSAFTLGLHGSF